jgi:predicted amidohydrolase YtcJ
VPLIDGQPAGGRRHRHRGPSVPLSERRHRRRPAAGIIDSGIHVGAGSDSAQISTLDPWNMIYSWSRAKNVARNLVNAGQQITREEARLYTSQERLVSPGGDQAGLERGRQARRFGCCVPDGSLRTLDSVLTIVDGRVAHKPVDL